MYREINVFPHGFLFKEIYRIVSQKQLRDPTEEEATIRPNNVETINVKPTVNTESVRKQCCNS